MQNAKVEHINYSKADSGSGKGTFPAGNSRGVPMCFHDSYYSAALKGFSENTLFGSGDGREGVAEPSQVPIGDGSAGRSGGRGQVKDELADGGSTNEHAPSDGGRRG